jgi:hypothetical protein
MNIEKITSILFKGELFDTIFDTITAEVLKQTYSDLISEDSGIEDQKEREELIQALEVVMKYFINVQEVLDFIEEQKEIHGA